MNKRSRDKKLAKNSRDPHIFLQIFAATQYPVGKIQAQNERIPGTLFVY